MRYIFVLYNKAASSKIENTWLLSTQMSEIIGSKLAHQCQSSLSLNQYITKVIQKSTLGDATSVPLGFLFEL
jgi:hypothetical protein